MMLKRNSGPLQNVLQLLTELSVQYVANTVSVLAIINRLDEKVLTDLKNSCLRH